MSVLTTLLDQLLNGLTIGIVYVLLAAGLSIIFGVMDVLNFAHGELFALGGYLAFSAAAPLGPETGFWVGLVVAPLVVGGLGMAVERFTVRPLYGRSPLYHILLTFGLVLIINDGIKAIWGRQALQFSQPPALGGALTVLGYSYSKYNLFMIGFGALLAVATWLVLERTRFGLIVRGGAEDREMVRNLGIDIDRYYTLVFGLGAALAGLAGVILGAYQSVSPTMGMDAMNPAFVIVVIGGLGSFPGAVIGGLAVGLIQAFSRVYVPQLTGLVLYLIMIVVLLIRPQGLFGTAVEHTPDSGSELLTGRGGLVGRVMTRRLGVASVAALALLPVVANVFDQGYLVTLFINILVWALFAMSLDFVMGYTGLVSLGQAMFYGLGSYAAMLVLVNLTPSVLVAMVAAIAVSAVVAWGVGFVSIRVSGVYFAMITLAFGIFFYNLVFKVPWVGGSDGMFGATTLFGLGGVGFHVNDITVGYPPFQFTGQSLYYYFLLGVVVATYLVARRLLRAPFGSVLKSIRENAQRSEFVGYDVTVYKRRAFTISGAMAGLAGALYVFNYGYVAPANFYWLRSAEVVVMVVLGGMGTLFGPMLGAGVFVGFKDVLSSYIAQWRLVFGLVFVLFVIFIPQGLVSVPALLADRFGSGADEAAPELANQESGSDD